MPREQSEFVLEIRYQANARVLDHRGRWAEIIASHMDLPNWLIVDNRLDVLDAEKHTPRCFVSFRNAGYLTTNPPANNFFIDQSIKFFKYVASLDDFQNPLGVDRIGVRSRFLKPWNGTMKELVGRYEARYCGPKSDVESALGGKLIDIGAALNFADKYGNFNTNGGPMPSEQAKDFFPLGDDFPKVGLYYDIDYWIRPSKVMTTDEVIKIVRHFSNESMTKVTTVTDLIMGEPPYGQASWLEKPTTQRPQASA